MIQHITPDEMSRLNMLLFLQRTAGIETNFEELIAGWRALSEPAKANIVEAYQTMVNQSAKFIITKGMSNVPK